MKSKLDDKNLEYKPPTSTKRIETRRLVWRAESKIENNNLDYKKKALATSMENGIDKTPKVSVIVGLSDLILACCKVGNGCCMSVIAQITYSSTDSILSEKLPI